MVRLFFWCLLVAIFGQARMLLIAWTTRTPEPTSRGAHGIDLRQKVAKPFHFVAFEEENVAFPFMESILFDAT